MSWIEECYNREIGTLVRACPVIHAGMISYCLRINGTGFKGSSSNLAYLESDSYMLSLLRGLVGSPEWRGLEYLNASNLKNWLGGQNSEGSPLLEEWSLTLCHEVRFPGWLVIGLNCKKLTLLDASRRRNLCNRRLQALRDGCDHLEVLHTNGCAKVTSTGLEIFKIMRYNVAIRMDE
uniref:Uncharacterized protein n=1 Tax=Ananas comosus var. bracteatus TaxID=296719 RepID=A0A6V7NEH8_ANACO|nr:unnamed protein product [Ananas comosus var. bracteatus]